MGSRPEESNLTAPFPGLLCQKKYPLPFTTDRTISRPSCARRTDECARSYMQLLLMLGE